MTPLKYVRSILNQSGIAIEVLFLILIALMCFQIPLIRDDYKRDIRCQFVLKR